MTINYPLLGHVQNSNTAVKIMVEAAGLELKLPKSNGKDVWAPGIESSEFKHTTFDKSLITAIEKYLELYNSAEQIASNFQQIISEIMMKLYHYNNGNIELNDNMQNNPFEFVGSFLEFSMLNNNRKYNKFLEIYNALELYTQKLNIPKFAVEELSENIRNKDYLSSKVISLCEGTACKSKLFYELRNNNEANFLKLLESGASPNAGSVLKNIRSEIHTPPINYASALKNNFYLSKLIEFKAVINTNKLKEIDSITRGTPLIQAIDFNLIDNVILLLNGGADINLLDCGDINCEGREFTPLHDSISRQFFDISKILLDYGANPDLGVISSMISFGQNQEKNILFNHRTPLYYSIENKDLKALELLLKAGACIENGLYEVYDYNEKIRKETSYELAMKRNNIDIQELIKLYPCENIKEYNLSYVYDILHSYIT